MFLKLKKLNRLRPRIILSFTLTLGLSVVGVSIIIYILLSTALRKNDHQRLVQQAHYLFSTFYTLGHSKLETEIDKENLFIIKDAKNQVVYEKFPTYFDGDFEDKEEEEQLKKIVKHSHMPSGWHTILLLSGEEDLDILHNWEHQLRLWVWRQNWNSLLPLIDNDMFEVYTFKKDGYIIHYGTSAEGREEYLSSIRKVSLTVILPFLAFGIFISYILAQGILSPIQQLILSVRRIKKNGFLEQVSLSGNGDEIDVLAEEFNGLMGQNEILMSQLKDNLDNVAHDIRTPLTRFRMRVEEVLTGEKNKESLQTALENSIEDIDQILNLLTAIMDLTESETGSLHLNKESVDLKDILSRLYDLYELYAEENKVKLRFSYPKDTVFVRVDKIRFIQALANILDNAIKYSPPLGEVKVSFTTQDSFAFIVIEDEGEGIHRKDAPYIWNRLYRGDKSRQSKGMGIGLSLAKAIILAHEFEVYLDEEAEKGARFVVKLPICNE